MIKHYTLIVSGKVQGVFYRQTTLEIATRIGIKGFVKNLPDGSVGIEAEGTAEQLDKLIAWCKTGPPRAKVNELKCTEEEIKNFSSFEIKR